MKNTSQAGTIHKAIQTALEHHQAGRLPQAEAIYRQVLQEKPDQPDALHLLGVIAYHEGRNAASAELISKAIRTRPSGPMYNNLGLALHAQGKFDAAVESYRKALSFQPNDAMAHNNLGNALQAQGKLDEAIRSYQKALTLMPDFAQAHSNMGLALQAQGEFGMAIVSHQRALQFVESPENKTGFVQCIKGIDFINEVAGIRPLVMRAISEPWGRPNDLAVPALSLIRLNPDINGCIGRAADAWPTRLSGQELFGPSGLATVAGDQLLQCLLENAPAGNMDMERFLTMARFAMLDAAAKAVVSDAVAEEILAFYCALARQCFITEYVFACTDEELGQARLLRERLVAALASGSPVPALWLAAVAAYFPLSSLHSDEILLERPWPEAVAALLAQQVREPMEERQLRACLPKLTAVDDNVSQLVQQQYEENSYPRWVKSPPHGRAIMLDAFLREHFPFAPCKPVVQGDEIDILIAGCGTGRHSIETARKFRGARVLAVDLSLASLGYAKRKTLEIGLENIEYAQADIMKLGGINRTFDVIESVGVLHHLADPMAGWRILLSLLRPGGLMYLGFYSELARRHIVAARNFIAERGYDASNTEDIRLCRQDIMNLMTAEDNTQIRPLALSGDFYATSACRDLIFHVQEHRYTLRQLKESLEELGLDFIGFHLEQNIKKQYREKFPGDPSETNLDCWNTFENGNPDTFAGMYQFWVQKRG